MCTRAYLNGDGSGYKTHLSLYIALMKGEYDALLRWPFDYKVSMILVGKEGGCCIDWFILVYLCLGFVQKGGAWGELGEIPLYLMTI